MLKHGLIADKEHWIEILNSNSELKGETISHSAEIKRNIVSQDFKEQGLRKTLNFGHTIGHAIESYCWSIDNPILHGEAVAAGMICASYLSYKKAGLSLEEMDEVVSNLHEIFPKIKIEDNKAVLEWLNHDKKNSNDQFQFVLLNKIGEAIYNQTTSKEEAMEALEFYNML